MSPLYLLASTFEAFTNNAHKAPSATAFESLFDEMNCVEAKLHILSIIDEAIEAVIHLKLNQTRSSAMLSSLLDLKGNFLEKCSLVTVHEVSAHVKMAAYIPLLNSFGDTVETSGFAAVESLDRASLIASTENLVKSIVESDLPEYAKMVMNLKLSALTRIVQDCSFYSDGDIRQRVKSIHSDFCVEFENNDKKYKSTREKVNGWASKYTKKGSNMLSIAASGVTIAALLPPM